MINLNQALQLLIDRKEFVIKEYMDMVCINYVCTLPDSFDGYRKNFRGIHFNSKTGELISLPLHKFFNIGQIEDLHYDKIKHLKGKVYEKLDGSYIQTIKLPNGEIKLGTRFGCTTDQAQMAENWARKNKHLWQK